MSGVEIVRQAAIGEVCAVVPKSARCGASVPSIGGFERTLLTTNMNCRCSRRSKAQSWPQNRRDPANVGLGGFGMLIKISCMAACLLVSLLTDAAVAQTHSIG